jgi:hypothetical protein
MERAIKSADSTPDIARPDPADGVGVEVVQGPLMETCGISFFAWRFCGFIWR